MELRPYQTVAVDAILAELRQHDSTLLQVATGLGKTVVFSAVARRCRDVGKRTLVLAHRRELLDQAAATLQRFGLGVGIEQGDRRVDYAALPDVVVASVQSMRARLARFPRDAFRLVVVDEAHHTPAKTYQVVLQHFAGTKLLGVTATPRRSDGKPLSDDFASVAHKMDLIAGIKGGWLSPVRLRTVRVAGLDLAGVRVSAGDLNAKDLGKRLTQPDVLARVAGPLDELAADRRTLAFVATVSHAEALAVALTERGTPAARVDGTMSTEERDSARARLEGGELKVVCNALLWCEGFDCPSVDCIALVRPTRSRSLVIQQIGRGTRLSESKRDCLVIDFLADRPGKMKLASPVDALGKELTARARALVRSSSECSAVDVLAAGPELERQEAARATEALQSARVVFDAPFLDIALLLDSADSATPVAEYRQASQAQVERLITIGFRVDGRLLAHQAEALFGIVRRRREEGLCSIRQARILKRHGLPDNLGYEQAKRVMGILQQNSWRYVPDALRAELCEQRP